MQTILEKMKTAWLNYLLLSFVITAAGVALSCLLLLDYNFLLQNQLSITTKVILVLLGGIVASIIPSIINIKSIKRLLNSSPLKSKYVKLIFLNLPLLIFQAFVLFVVVVIILWD